MRKLQIAGCVKLFIYLLFFFLHFNSSLTAQNTKSLRIAEKNMAFYNLLRENVHLHLNKTTFFNGEQLWFTAYVYDQYTQLPSSESTNLYVGIFDGQGHAIEKQIIYIEDGVGSGNIMIDSSYTDTEYYIKSYTNWMKNFSEIKPFIQKIRVLRNIERPPENELIKDVTIAIYPEGGKLIKDAENSFGFQITDPLGKGIEVKKIILENDLGEIIKSNLVTNIHGMGKVTFFQERERIYFLSTNLNNGPIIKKKLPPAETRGIVLKLSSIDREKIYGKLVINSETLNKIDENPYYMAVHQNEQVFMEELFIKSETTPFSLEKAKLPFGVNAITIFDHMNNPIIRRLFFNEFGSDKINEDISLAYKWNATKDSLLVDLSLKNASDGSMSLSISALPYETVSYAPNNSLLSSFLLMPYINFSVEHPGVYFEDRDRISMFNLDILLLNQGWGTYNWDRIFGEQQNVEYVFESGVNIHGKILDADLGRENQVWVKSKGVTTSFLLDIKRDKTINTNAILFKGDSLMISVLNTKGKLRKPRAEIEFTPLSAMGPQENIDIVPFNNNNRFVTTYSTDIDIPISPGSELPVIKKTIALDEVVVIERIPSPNDIPINSAEFTGKRITDEDIKRRGTLLHYLSNLGYGISILEGRVTVMSRIIGSGGATGKVPVPVFIGGLLSDGTDLLTMPLDGFQSIFFDSWQREFISLELRYGHYNLDKKKHYISYLINSGFARPKEYYDPGYISYLNFEFKMYGVLNWLPKVILNKNNHTTIKIPIMDQTGIILYIEGLGSDGKLISTSKSINLEDD